MSLTAQEIEKRKKVGDNELVASMVGITGSNVSGIFKNRPENKWYNEIIECFTIVIQTHEKMIREYRLKKENENSNNL
jgi:hypothetical protein